MNVATTIQEVEEYYFSKKLREIEQLKTKGVDVINAGIGSPDLRPHETVINELQASTKDENAHQYQSYRGISELREAFSSWYKKYYNYWKNIY